MKSLITKSYPFLKLAKWLTRNTPKIIMYHSFSESKKDGYVSTQNFEWQLQTIKRNFTPMSLIDLAKAYESKKPVPKNAVVITIDDGYRNVYDCAFPLLKKYQIPATFFVTTNFIDKIDWLWPDKLKWLLNNNKTKETHIEFDGLKTELFFGALNNLCLSLENARKLRFIDQLAKQLNLTLPVIAPCELSACTWPELEEMQNNGIEVGSHTLSHPSLGQVSTKQAHLEIEQSLAVINTNLGNIPRTFCYPNGQPNDYNAEIIKIVEAAGYKAAVTAFSDKFELEKAFSWRRFDGGGNREHFLKVIHGVEMTEHRIKRRVISNE